MIQALKDYLETWRALIKKMDEIGGGCDCNNCIAARDEISRAELELISDLSAEPAENGDDVRVKFLIWMDAALEDDLLNAPPHSPQGALLNSLRRDLRTLKF